MATTSRYTTLELILWRWRCLALESLDLRFAPGALIPDVEPVLVEGHRRVKRRQVPGGDQIRRRGDGDVALGVVEEREGYALLLGVHQHPVLHALVHGVAKYLSMSE